MHYAYRHHLVRSMENPINLISLHPQVYKLNKLHVSNGQSIYLYINHTKNTLNYLKKLNISIYFKREGKKKTTT